MKHGEKCFRCYKENLENCGCNESTDLQQPPQQYKVEYPAASSVVIKVETKLPESPHIVNLSQQTPETRFDSIDVFREKMKFHSEPVVIDVGQLVKQINQEEVIKNQDYVINSQKKVISQLISSGGSVPIKKTTPINNFFKKRGTTIKQPKKVFTFKLPKLNGKQNNSFYFSYKKFAIAVLIFAIIIGVPFPAAAYYKKIKLSQQEVIDQSTNAFGQLQLSTLAGLEGNIPVAQQGLQQALEGFSAAENILKDEHQIITAIGEVLPFVGTQIKSGRKILQAGQYLALGNTYLVKGLSAAAVEEELPISDKFLIIKRHLQYAIPQYERALEEVSGVKSQDVPIRYQASFKEVKLLLATFVDDLRDLRDLADAIHTLFGGDELKRYLVIFQNQHEIRPTGGFMGSFALVDVQKGKIVNIEVPEGGTYDLKGQLDSYVKAPLPLQLVNGRWEFQDANWFPDFPTTAKKISWFYQHSRGATVDGVIAVNATVLERFLRVAGPVTVDEQYDILLNADTALANLQSEVELGDDKAQHKPKKIISVILSQLLEQLPTLSKVKMISLLGEIHESVQQKEIQVFATDTNIQSKLQEFGWTGNILPTQPGQDYLFVVNANIQGQKSDARVKQVIDYVVELKEDGNMYATVTIDREHIGSPGEQFYGNTNINYLRVYVPKGSELVGSGGFEFPPEEAFHTPEEWYTDDEDLLAIEKDETYDKNSGSRISTEFDKTVFGNWVIVEPGQKTSVYFTYKLPFKANMLTKQDNTFLAAVSPKQNLAHKYSLIIQKQSGSESSIDTRLIYPKNWQPAWKSEEDITLTKDGYVYQNQLDQDSIIGVVMQKLYD